MTFLLAVLAGYLLDILIGDPAWFPHPVRIIGWWASRMEKRLRAKYPDDREGQMKAGRRMVIVIPLVTFLVSGGICWGLYAYDHLIGMIPQVLWCWQCLASRDLAKHSKNVWYALEEGDLFEAQEAVGEIVGRDVDGLDEAGVTRATVETVAESSSDGVIAPLFYMLFAGAPLALTYKAINTLDSMFGYKTPEYRYFGFYAAKLDDLANLIPSRLAARFWIVAAFFTRNDWRGARDIWKRDRSKHPSPNAGQCEAACAGALGVWLGGPSRYFGHLVKKPYIGDNLRDIENDDILRANRMMYVAGFLYLLAGGLLCTLLYFLMVLIFY